MRNIFFVSYSTEDLTSSVLDVLDQIWGSLPFEQLRFTIIHLGDVHEMDSVDVQAITYGFKTRFGDIATPKFERIFIAGYKSPENAADACDVMISDVKGEMAVICDLSVNVKDMVSIVNWFMNQFKDTGRSVDNLMFYAGDASVLGYRLCRALEVQTVG